MTSTSDRTILLRHNFLVIFLTIIGMAYFASFHFTFSGDLFKMCALDHVLFLEKWYTGTVRLRDFFVFSGENLMFLTQVIYLMNALLLGFTQSVDKLIYISTYGILFYLTGCEVIRSIRSENGTTYQGAIPLYFVALLAVLIPSFSVTRFIGNSMEIQIIIGMFVYVAIAIFFDRSGKRLSFLSAFLLILSATPSMTGYSFGYLAALNLQILILYRFRRVSLQTFCGAVVGTVTSAICYLVLLSFYGEIIANKPEARESLNLLSPFNAIVYGLGAGWIGHHEFWSNNLAILPGGEKIGFLIGLLWLLLGIIATLFFIYSRMADKTTIPLFLLVAPIIIMELVLVGRGKYGGSAVTSNIWYLNHYQSYYIAVVWIFCFALTTASEKLSPIRKKGLLYTGYLTLALLISWKTYWETYQWKVGTWLLPVPAQGAFAFVYPDRITTGVESKRTDGLLESLLVDPQQAMSVIDIFYRRNLHWARKIQAMKPGSDHATGVMKFGWHTDGWMGNLAHVTIMAGEAGKLNIKMAPIMPDNSLEMYVNGKKMVSFESGPIDQTIDVIPYSILRISFYAKQVYIPAKIGNSPDLRELSYVVQELKAT